MRLPFSELPTPDSRVMSGVMRNASRCEMLPVTLMYVRATLNPLRFTSLPSVSVTSGFTW